MLADLIALGQASGYKNLFYGRTEESNKKKTQKDEKEEDEKCMLPNMVAGHRGFSFPSSASVHTI